MAAPLLYAVPGALKAGLGLYQTIRGSAMRPKRPTYEIPSEIKESLALARQQEAGRMPGFAYAEDRLRQQSSQSLYGLRRGATSANQLMSGMANIQLQSSIGQRSLAESEASDYYRRLSNLQRGLGLSAKYVEKEFEMNKMEPYQDRAKAKAALIQAGLTNVFAGGGEAVMQPEYAKYLQSNMGQEAAPQQANPFVRTSKIMYQKPNGFNAPQFNPIGPGGKGFNDKRIGLYYTPGMF